MVERYLAPAVNTSAAIKPESDDGARLFAVLSWGCTATHWLAGVLDRHPELRCFHNLNGTIVNVAGGDRLDGRAYAEVLLRQALGYRAVGEVHGFGRRTIADVRRALDDRFQCAILVRDPVPRFRSLLALYRGGAEEVMVRHRRAELEYIKPIGRAVGIDYADGDYRNWLVVHGAYLLNEILKERLIAPIVRMEDVVGDPDALVELVSQLTGGAVRPDRAWALSVQAGPRVERHWNGEPLNAAARRALDLVVKPATWDAYRALGYSCELGSS